jgi:type I restriction enzyme, S subunit
MSFPRYPSYKRSDIGWAVDTPEHWELLPCRGFVDERTEKNEDAACQSYLSLMANVGVIPYEEKGDIGNKKPDDLSKCKIVQRGDFVINSMNYGIGSYGVSAYDGVCSPVYIVLTPRPEVVEPRFAFRVFEDKSFQAYAQSFGNGILAHRCAIGWDDLKAVAVGIPPAAEQKSILNFLDRETAKIDALIAEQQRLIELLQEKRQAVISHAVTKGLNPNAPMKDSGVEWLGEVPEHWEVKPLKHMCEIYSGFPFKSDLFQPDGIPVVRMSNISDGTIDLQDAVCVPEHEVPSEALIRSGDLLLGLSGSVGNFGIARKCDLPAAVNQRVALVRTNNPILKHFLGSSLFSDQVTCGLPSTTIANVSASQLGNCLLAVPPLNEQQQIEDFLYDFAGSSVELRDSAESSISLLQERRSALISAAVTGQIDVRGLATEEEP